jgi:vacuolar protein sorting-associated protein 26
VNKKFSTRYYLNLVLIDEENRRYFKQQVRIRRDTSPSRAASDSVAVGNHRL